MRVKQIISHRSACVNVESRSRSHTRRRHAQFEGGDVAPALQLKFTALLYPLTALSIDCPRSPVEHCRLARKFVAELFAIENSKSGAAVSANRQTPRP
jgi:hypothetical protein